MFWHLWQIHASGQAFSGMLGFALPNAWITGVSEARTGSLWLA